MIRVLFFGTPHFSVPTLVLLSQSPLITVAGVITQPDRPTGRGATVTPPPIKQCAQSLGIPVFQPHSLKREFASLKDDLAAIGPFDIGVVIAFGQILPREVLAFPRMGCVNIHASILPRWRGAAPIQRAIEMGDPETGVCLMRMDVGLDTGAVFSTSRTPILDSDTYESLHDRLSRLGAEVLLRDIAAIVGGSLIATPQAEEGVTYAKKISPDEARVDWSQAAVEVARKIRALYPSPGCHTTWGGKRLKILKARPVELATDAHYSPGTVLQALADTLTISCGSGALRLEEVQLEGKKRMSAGEFLRGSPLTTGSRFE